VNTARLARSVRPKRKKIALLHIPNKKKKKNPEELQGGWGLSTEKVRKKLFPTPFFMP